MVGGGWWVVGGGWWVVGGGWCGCGSRTRQAQKKVLRRLEEALKDTRREKLDRKHRLAGIPAEIAGFDEKDVLEG